jgi:GGDEF domain-containing protein
VAVLFVALDDFGMSSDGDGHPASDAVLAEAAERLSSLVQRRPRVSRLAERESALLVEAGVVLAATVAEQVQAERQGRVFARPTGAAALTPRAATDRTTAAPSFRPSPFQITRPPEIAR